MEKREKRAISTSLRASRRITTSAHVSECAHSCASHAYQRVSPAKAAHTTVLLAAWAHQNCHGSPHNALGSPRATGQAMEIRDTAPDEMMLHGDP